jgi:hypothetical protein
MDAPQAELQVALDGGLDLASEDVRTHLLGLAVAGLAEDVRLAAYGDDPVAGPRRPLGHSAPVS